MPIAKLLVTQSGADTLTSTVIPLPSLDGKSAYNIKGIEAYWVDGAAVAAADYSIDAIVATVNTSITFVDDEWIASVSWGLQNTLGTAVAIPYEPMKSAYLNGERLTVQENVYAMVKSSATGQANDIIFRVEYEIEKISELEYLRLLAGGA